MTSILPALKKSLLQLYILGFSFVAISLLCSTSLVVEKQNERAELLLKYREQHTITPALLNLNGALALHDKKINLSVKLEVLDASKKTSFVREVNTNNITIYYQQPIIVVLGSIWFWLYIIIVSMSVFYFRIYLRTQYSQALKPLSRLEQWAKLPTKQRLTPLPTDNAINLQINQLQQDLLHLDRTKHRFELKFRESALLDSQTKLGTHDAFTGHLSALLAEAGSRGAVFFIYLKGCEVCQSLYGEEEALKLLSAAIASIKGRIITLPDCFMSRCGEFELAVLAPDLYVNDCEKLADRLLQNLLALPVPIGVNKEELCHFGISYFKAGRDSYQVMAEADMALRSAQLQGPAQWFMYDPGEIAKERAIGSLKWRTFIQKVIENKLFVIFSQPAITTETGHALHFEVFSKIQDNKKQLINPRVFLPMLEKCGLSKSFDIMVFEQLCLLIWHEQEKQFSYSINLSLDAILSPIFRDRFYQLLNERHNISQQIIIEISEYHLHSHLMALTPILNEFHQHGIRILADKVGQYIVSTQYLAMCHISYLKLHASVVLDIENKPNNQMLVKSINVLAEPLGIDLYAVGVETIGQWQMLKKLGVYGGQGNYFHKPIAKLATAIGP